MRARQTKSDTPFPSPPRLLFAMNDLPNDLLAHVLLCVEWKQGLRGYQAGLPCEHFLSQVCTRGRLEARYFCCCRLQFNSVFCCWGPTEIAR